MSADIGLRFKVGDVVDYHSVIDEPATELGLVICHAGYIPSSSLPVYWLEGKSGCVVETAISIATPLPQPAPTPKESSNGDELRDLAYDIERADAAAGRPCQFGLEAAAVLDGAADELERLSAEVERLTDARDDALAEVERLAGGKGAARHITWLRAQRDVARAQAGELAAAAAEVERLTALAETIDRSDLLLPERMKTFPREMPQARQTPYPGSEDPD